MPLQTNQRLFIFGVLLLVLAAVVGLGLTWDSRIPTNHVVSEHEPIVDEQPVQTARTVTVQAESQEEQRYAQQALRLADHAVDLAFASAMREATLHPAAKTPQAKELFDRVKRAEAQVQSDQELIDTLKKEAEKNKAAPLGQQQLDLLQAQMELDKDELEDARAEVLRSGVDSLGQVQRQFSRYQATQQQAAAAQAQANLPAGESGATARNLRAQFTAWRAQGSKIRVLQQAREETVRKREELKAQHAIAEQSNDDEGKTGDGSAVSQDQAVINSLRHLSERHKNLVDLTNRIQDHQDLADVYGNWLAFVQVMQRSTVHAILQSVLIVLLIVLLIYVADLAVDRFFVDLIQDRRRMRTLRTIVRFALQATGVLFVLFVLFGIPEEMPTILGLAGAGLTVVLKDFIVAFFGWFALMGRNGIRVGDWVEIQGVVGEVAEIGLLRTVLLETGNWNAAGHPTGRKVAFINSFAIEGHYFNFSTSGQWLWDELHILVPSSQDPYPLIEEIQKLVTSATEANAQNAQEEWKRATRDRMHSVSAAPAINLRPTPSGVEVHIRYITRAQERYSTRAKLYQDIADLMHQRFDLAGTGRKA